MPMTRGEWGLVAVILVASLLCLTLISPADILEAQERSLAAQTAQAPVAELPEEPTAVPTPTPTAVPTAVPPTPTPTMSPTPMPTPFPFDTRPDEERYIYIDQLTQRMYIFVHGELLREIPCSTGLPTPGTTTEAWEGRVGEYWGTFQSFGVYADDAWFLFRSLGSILIHSLPYTFHGEAKAYQDWGALGVRPSSHGCIRISPQDAQWLTEWNPEGALVTISDPHVEYGRVHDRPPTLMP